MALFGEIVQPTSRTTWEDWDDDIAQHTPTALNWSKSLDIPEHVNKLIILEGKYLSNCIAAQSADFLCLVNTIDGANIKLYKVNLIDKVTYICATKDYDLLYSSDIVELMKTIINKSDNILSIVVKPLSVYQSIYPVTNSCVVRKIISNNDDKNNFNFKLLEQPNIVSGISAGIISLREQQKLSATLLIYYVEGSSEYEIEEINKMLEKLEIIKSSKGMIKKVLTSNLYV